jgi:putative membrane protein
MSTATVPADGQRTDSPAAELRHARAPGDLLQDILCPQRLKQLYLCDPGIQYDPNTFLLVFHLRHRNSEVILAPLLILAVWYGVCVAAFVATPPSFSDQLRRFAEPLNETMDPLHSVISFLLVFRLGRAALRYWDCRSATGRVVEVSRCLASEACAAAAASASMDAEVSAAMAAAREPIMRWTAAFPMAVKNFLRCNQGAQCDRRAELGSLLEEADAQSVLTPDGALFVLNRLRAAVWRFSQLQASSQPQLNGMCLRALCEEVDRLTGAFGAMERIEATPLPFVYVAHLRTFLMLYLVLIALPAIAEWNAFALPGLFAMSWALLGIEAAAMECERPFQRRANHLKLGAMCVRVAEAVAQAVGDLPIGDSCGNERTKALRVANAIPDSPSRLESNRA